MTAPDHLSEDYAITRARALGDEAATGTQGFVSPNGEVTWPVPGLTKRELFAMTAMGHLAAAHVQGGITMSPVVAKQAVEYADALLKELAK